MSIPAPGLPILFLVTLTTRQPCSGCTTTRLPLLTTDFVLDELLTLLKLRENYALAVAAGNTLLHKAVAKVEQVSEGDFIRAWEVFQQYHDKEWSFTDCTSKVVIERLGITHAFAFDSHFEQFGTVIRVP